MKRSLAWSVRLVVLGIVVSGLLRPAWAQPAKKAPVPLETQLLAEDPARLAREARDSGDPARGAVYFHQGQLACTKCHVARPGERPIGPDLTRANRQADAKDRLSDAQIVEAVLNPSKSIRPGYETISLVTSDGKALTGLLVEERPDALVLRDSARDFQTVTLAKRDIDERGAKPASLMPTGLANQLANRQQFLDLASYLLEIVERGPARERELRPIALAQSVPPLPEYEGRVDHAGLIAALDAKALARGAAIYGRSCVNCHGTHDAPGSLPTSLRFASGVFKNGSDPYSIYRTLTHGYGMMTPQRWMVPRQKYDVIHYLREEYLRKANPSQLTALDADYLRKLPVGDTFGPEPSRFEAWSAMNYGPTLMATYEVGRAGNFAYKGIAARLDPGEGGVSQGRQWMVFEHDTLRMAGAWSGEGNPRFIDWNGINFNGGHQVHPHVAGEIHVQNPPGPGWANPANGSFDDPRPQGRDGKPYGPLPKEWGDYRGLYHYGSQAVLSYRVGKTDVLEMPVVAKAGGHDVWQRVLNLGSRPQDLIVQAARHGARGATLRTAAAGEPGAPRMLALLAGESGEALAAGLAAPLPGAEWRATESGDLRLRIPAGQEPLRITLWTVRLKNAGEAAGLLAALDLPAARDLEPLTRGGPPRWGETLRALPVVANDPPDEQGPFAVDILTLPDNQGAFKNPWNCQLRLTGLDFLEDGKQMAVCSWDGDVWLVSGIEPLDAQRPVAWRRIASGLFQPLGLKVHGGAIYVGCRDQIVILRDLNGDGETDFYQAFHHDHQVTEHFHEFAMGLQSDEAGAFYYAKSARHALPAIVPQHGTLVRVSPDGSRSDILAAGFRAANGVCLNPDGSFVVTDQEGHWTPKNRINWVTPGGFYGNMMGYHDVKNTADSAMQPPLCWITNTMDRSPAELLWVNSKQWGPLSGSLLNLSYGGGRAFIVPHERTAAGVVQGGVSPLPIGLFPTGLVRGRFHPTNGQLYVCGMCAWGGNQTEPGGLYRIRYTGQPSWLTTGIKATRRGLELTFSDRIAADSLSPASEAFTVKTWGLVRSGNYGSKHMNEHALEVAGAELLPDGRTVRILLPEIAPTWGMEVRYRLRGPKGERVEGTLHNTIHQLAE